MAAFLAGRVRSGPLDPPEQRQHDNADQKKANDRDHALKPKAGIAGPLFKRLCDILYDVHAQAA